MAVYEVGAAATFANHMTAYAAALAAVDHGYEILTVEDGVYAGEVLVMDALDNGSYTRANGVDYTIHLDTTAIYSFRVGDGFAMIGGTIECTANIPVRSIAASFWFDNVTFKVNSGHNVAIAYPSAASTATLTNCRFVGDVQTITGGWTMLSESSIVCDGCYVHPNLTFSDGFARMSGATISTVSIRATPCESSTLLYVRVGQTVATATIQGCYASNLVDNNSTITTFVGGYNAYGTTDAGTTSPGDVSGVTDFDVDDNGYPRPTSPLYRMLPVGVDYTGPYDAAGNLRVGASHDCGPLQCQEDPAFQAAFVAVA